MTDKPFRGHRLPTRAALDKMSTARGTRRWLWIAIVLLVLQASGCIRVPDESWIVSHHKPMETRMQAADCAATTLDRFVPVQKWGSPAASKSGLNADGFRLLSWNVYKGKKVGWSQDFETLSQRSDILILQEAYLSDNLKQMLNREKYHWDMTMAFEYRNIEAGVLTASRTAPNFACTLLQKEPVTRIPKSVLITRYPMTGTDRVLLVANIHALNFTLGGSAFEKQTDLLEKTLATHSGPMVVSGDFNTWNADRMGRVTAMAKRLGLTAVKFDQNHRTQFFGHNVDHIYYRGLVARDAATPIVSTSDHNPLTVVFKLADEPDMDI